MGVPRDTGAGDNGDDGVAGEPPGRRRVLAPGKTFAEVLRAAQAGAAWAFAQLYEELAPPVAGYLRIQGAAAPAELTSAVFLEVFGELDGFRGGQRQLRTRVFTVAHRRLTGPRPQVRDPAGGLPGESGQQWLLRVSTVLSAQQRTVLALRIAGGLTAAEVAEVTGEAIGTIRTWQREGLVALQRHLADDRPTGTPCE